jgi:hypothetical protein
MLKDSRKECEHFYSGYGAQSGARAPCIMICQNASPLSNFLRAGTNDVVYRDAPVHPAREVTSDCNMNGG